jgi:hypothetical protein
MAILLPSLSSRTQILFIALFATAMLLRQCQAASNLDPKLHAELISDLEAFPNDSDLLLAEAPAAPQMFPNDKEVLADVADAFKTLDTYATDHFPHEKAQISEAKQTFEDRVAMLLGQLKDNRELHDVKGIEKKLIQLQVEQECLVKYSECVKERTFPAECLKTSLKCAGDQNELKAVVPSINKAVEQGEEAYKKALAQKLEDVKNLISTRNNNSKHVDEDSAALEQFLQSQGLDRHKLQQLELSLSPRHDDAELDHCVVLMENMINGLGSHSNMQSRLDERYNMTLYKSDKASFCRNFMNPKGTRREADTLIERRAFRVNEHLGSLGKDLRQALGVSHGASLFSHAAQLYGKRRVGYRKEDTPLNRLPMLMSHDAGTGYGMSGLGRVLTAQTQTQLEGFQGQLNCGIRAFDIRPYLTGTKNWGSRRVGEMKMHHGGYIVDKSLKEALQDVVNWANQNPDELILLLFSHPAGFDKKVDAEEIRSKCWDILKELQIPYWDSSQVKGATVKQAYEKAWSTNKQRSVLGIWTWGGISDNYHSSLTCYGSAFKKCYTDWQNWLDDSKYRNAMFESLKSYSKYPPTKCCGKSCTEDDKKKLIQQQAHWQQDAESFIGAAASGSSIVLDTRKSEINQQIANRLNSNFFESVNLVEVDDICGSSPQALYDAIRRKQIAVLGSMANGGTHVHHRHHRHHRHTPILGINFGEN